MEAEEWGLARSVPKGISCNFCWLPITTSKPLKPGTKRGTRGTKAYYCPARRVYECLRCGTERVRADEARDRMTDEAQRARRPAPDRR